MPTLRSRFWLWGQSPGSHHRENGNRYRLPGINRMTPAEGCAFFGIPNCCRVVMENLPAPPFDPESETLKNLSQVVWSVVGSGGSSRTDAKLGDLDDVLNQARKYPNVTGGILDDFLNARRRTLFSPADVAFFRERLHHEIGRRLDLWIVLYAHEMSPEVEPYLAECDVVTFWTWRGSALEHLEENLDRFAAMTPGRKRLAGCYMWNYGESRPLTEEQMAHQCDLYLKYLRNGIIDGIIFCSNCIADLGIPAVEWTRRWIAEHADESIPEKQHAEE